MLANHDQNRFQSCLDLLKVYVFYYQTPLLLLVMSIVFTSPTETINKSVAVVDDNGFEYDDITVYKGQFYVIDTLGNVSWIDNLSKCISQMKSGVDGSWKKAWVIELFFNDQNETHVFNLEDNSFEDLQNIHPSQLLSNLLQAYVRQYTSKVSY